MQPFTQTIVGDVDLMRAKLAIGVILTGIVILAVNQSPAQDGKSLSEHLMVDDAKRFAEIYNQNDNDLSAEILGEAYLEKGTPGLKLMLKSRIHSAEFLAEAIRSRAHNYEKALSVCLPAAEAMAPALVDIEQKYKSLLGQKEWPDIYIVIGANNSGGIKGDKEVIVALEVVCREDTIDADNAKNQLVSFIVHEMAHTFQPKRTQRSLLAQTLNEGGAEFLTKELTGQSLYPEAEVWVEQRWDEVWTAFMRDVRDPERKGYGEAGFSGYGPWLYSSEQDLPENWPKDMGYVVGERIIRAYYETADDKKKALKEILRAAKSPNEFLRKSGLEGIK